MVTSEESPKDAAPLQQKLSPDSAGHNVSLSDREGSSPLVPEKPSEDGYNWRKYGQKNIKGNEFIRSYYKCSSLNCQVKKQVERAHDGRITDTTYFGKHDHPKPQPNPHVDFPSPLPAQVKIPDQSLSVIEDKSSNASASVTDGKVPKETHEVTLAQVSSEAVHAATLLSSGAKDDSNGNQNQAPKRRKKVIESAEAVVDKPSGESRVVVETVSAVDILNDGYRWRKYGQKLVRGNSNPRSYYRCSNPGCPAKKQVERASHDPRVVVTAYEGQHDHNVPPIQTILPHNTVTTLSEPKNGAKPKPEEVTNPPDTPTFSEPIGAIPKTEGEINHSNRPNSSKAMNDDKPKKEVEINPSITHNSSEPKNGAKPKTEEINPQNTPTLSEPTNGAKTEQEEVDQARDCGRIPEQEEEKEVEHRADSPADPEITKTEQRVSVTKQEELRRPDTGVITSYPETKSSERQKPGAEPVSC